MAILPHYERHVVQHGGRSFIQCLPHLPHRTILCDATLRDATLRCATLRYATLYYTTLRYATLYYTALQCTVYDSSARGAILPPLRLYTLYFILYTLYFIL